MSRLDKVKEADITRKQVWAVMRNARTLRDAALISFLFLTGMRITEIVGGILNKRMYYDKYEKKYYLNLRQVPAERKKYVVMFNHENRLEPLKIYSWQRTKKLGHDFIEVQGPVLKGRKWPPENSIRVIPINEAELPFIKVVELYIKDKSPESIMFKMTRVRAFQIVKQLSIDTFGNTAKKGEWWFNHLFRHKRHGILAGEYFLDVPQLKSFSGWKTDSMPIFYAKQNRRDIMTRMIHAHEGS